VDFIHNRLYSVFIPSLNCEAIVPKQEVYLNQHPKGYDFAGIVLHQCSASREPRLSIYLSLPNQQNRMSIFSNWVAAPNSGVITYKETSE
jgi:hypothetical protein